MNVVGSVRIAVARIQAAWPDVGSALITTAQAPSEEGHVSS